MDRVSIEEHGLPGRMLMELAGSGAARRILERLPDRAGRAVVLCGPGGNGGDGYVVARHLVDAGWHVRCVSPVDIDALDGSAGENGRLWRELNGETRFVREKVPRAVVAWMNHAHVIVDGLLGTGQTREISGPYQGLVTAANAAERAVRVALDVPTGVCADSGSARGLPFRADMTVTFGLPTTGLYQGEGLMASGDVVVEGVAWPRSVIDGVGAAWRRVTPEAIAPWLPERRADGHKGTFGHVGVVGGAEGMAGAATLAALGALRSGAGLVTCLHLASERPPGLPPEVMTSSPGAGQEGRLDALVVGPGLGTSPVAADLVAAYLEDGRGRVLDADGLNLMASIEARRLPHGCVLTPHPLEAARLLGCDALEVQGDRPGAALELASQWNAVVLLKGAGSVIAAPQGPGYLLDVPEPTLAIPGSGDVLAGLIGGLLAQGSAPLRATVTAATLHLLVGQRLGRDSDHRGALASEVASGVPGKMDELRRAWVGVRS